MSKRQAKPAKTVRPTTPRARPATPPGPEKPTATASPAGPAQPIPTPATTPDPAPVRSKNVPSENLRTQILADFAALKVPLSEAEFDQVLAQAEREGLSHLEFLRRVISGQAGQRRERSIARRIREAKFRELKTLATFDWLFNAKAIDRSRFGALATGEFIRRRENLVVIGRSGVGKSHLVQAIGLEACVLGWRVRYTTSAELLDDLRSCLADRTLSAQVRYYAKFDLLIIDEFGFDRIERQESPEATHALFKVVDARNTNRSTALITNVDHKQWAAYLGDPSLAMGLTDRLVDRANIVRIEGGRSYRDEMRKPQS